jgi:hypothetical protein
VLVETAITKHQTGFAEQFGEEGVVGGDHVEQLGEGRRRKGRYLDLPPGFDRERRPGRERELGTVFDECSWSVGTKSGG